MNFPQRRLLKKSFLKPLKPRLAGSNQLLNSGNVQDSVSSSTSFDRLSLANKPTSSKEFMINYSFQNVPFEKQSPQKHKNLNTNGTSYNLSMGLNSLDSNLVRSTVSSNAVTPFYSYSLQKSN